MLFFAIICIALICYALFYILLLCLIDCDLHLAFCEKFGKPISSLHGKVVLITGASSGIGKHTAIALAKHGVKLALVARRKLELEHVKGLCIANSGGKLTSNDVLAIEMDVSNCELHENAFKLVLTHFGQVDIVLNNAGRSQRAAWEQIDLEVDRAVFDLNVFPVVNLTKIAVKYFQTRGHGYVAATSSIAGILGVPFSGSYTGSKYALHGYYNSLRNEKIGSELDLTVSLICPGPTYTNFLQESFTEKSGVKYGISALATDRRMTGERCGELVAVTLANKLNEVWLGIFPVILFSYLWVYFPLVANFILKVVGSKRMFKLRDSQDLKLNEVEKGH